jgi:hypothetical protein
MIKQQISEKEIETSASKSKAMRLHGRFLKGPIPMRDINSANRLPGQALSVLLAVHHQTALTRKRWVTLPAGLLTQLGISRDAKARALQQLEAAVLARVVRARVRRHGSRLDTALQPLKKVPYPQIILIKLSGRTRIGGSPKQGCRHGRRTMKSQSASWTSLGT